MQKAEWEDLKQRVFRDFPDICWVENVKARREHGPEWGCEEDPFFDDEGENIGLPWNENGDDNAPLLDIFGICGCGDPNSVIKKYFIPFLKAIKKKTDEVRSSSFEENMNKVTRETFEDFSNILKGEEVNVTSFKVVKDQTLEYLVLYFLDERGLIEHGTSITGSWITPKGETALLMCDAIYGKDE